MTILPNHNIMNTETRTSPIKKTNQKRKRRGRRVPPAQQYPVYSEDQSILKSEYIKQDRPYGQLELIHRQKRVFEELNLSHDVWVQHTRCGHTYHVKKWGQKFKQVMELNENIDVGNCSVCWKLRKVPRPLVDNAYYFTEQYGKIFEYRQNNDNYLVYDDMQVERIFYVWLYLENYE